jgi:hypothetical protein
VRGPFLLVAYSRPWAAICERKDKKRGGIRRPGLNYIRGWLSVDESMRNDDYIKIVVPERS